MFSLKNEEYLEKLGQVLFEKGIPLGFLNSDNFNPSFDDKFVKPFLENIHTKAVQKVGGELGSSSRKAKLLDAVYLLSQTVCYVSTTPKASDENSFGAGKVTTAVCTLSNDFLENYLDEDDVNKHIKKLNKLIESVPEHLQLGFLPAVHLTYNKGNTVKFPRKHANLLDGEFSIIPASVVYGYLSAIRKAMVDNIVVFNARKTEGVMREFVLTSDLTAVRQLYSDSEVLEMFSNLQSALRVSPSGVGNHVKLVDGLHNFNALYYEMGIPAKDYPKRMMNLSRIANFKLYAGEEQASLIRRLQRYADMDIDQTLSVVQEVVSKWPLEQINAFMVDTLEQLKASVNTSAETSIEIKGILDFLSLIHI